MAHEHLVLVVDDEPHTRAVYADVLRRSGAGVAVAEDGEVALEFVKSGLQPCVVLTDVRMPRMDGWALDRALHGISPELPVVLVTSDALLTLSGPVRAKPVAPAEIQAMVDGACHVVADEGSA